MSGNCFSNVGMNLSHLKYKGSICTLYLALVYLASQFASHINASCAFLVWVGSTKLTLWMVFHNAVVIILVFFLSEHLFFFHDMLYVVGHWDGKVVMAYRLL